VISIPYLTRTPCAASQCNGLSDFGSGASAGPILEPYFQSAGQMAM
jgi:hypothetical protein